MHVGVIVVAAGSGTRLGAGMPKALVRVQDWTVLDHALVRVSEAESVGAVVIVAPEAYVREAEAAAALALRDRFVEPRIREFAVVAGGATRQESVARGLAALPKAGIDVVLVHDAARALAPSDLFERVVAAVRRTGDGVVPALPLADTVKRVNAAGGIEATVDRSELVAVQTPQGFPRAVLEAAYAAPALEATDDAALVAAIGHPVRTIPGDELAFKVTTPGDLLRARLLLGPDWEALGHRAGVGVDAHAFRPGVPLMLGALEWPDAPEGLAGHSDGDVVCHAIVDAILSAAGLGDIGSVFGTADPQYEGAAGSRFLLEATAHAQAAGWTVMNVSVEIVANSPKIGPRRAEMEARLTELLDAPTTIAATTSDGLGLTGEGRGVAAVATALLARGRGSAVGVVELHR